ncbi:MAG: class I SAM-dependent methyltransferase [Proteobacteria bacterium]|nr:class I SAM-dependent methyltransferase [Pseudomonadota bacterium]
MEATAHSISAAVQKMYEVWPYPNYKFYLPLRWQEAYCSHSLFSRRLLMQTMGRSAPTSPTGYHILIAGCGDVLPSILGHWEPASCHMHGVDLSEHSLCKARLRCWLAARPQNLWQMNLEDSTQSLGGPYQHIDSYGVLHHLANPKQGLQRLFEALEPGGTMRIMVYNSVARTWIHHLKRAMNLLGLSAYVRTDLTQARKFLQLLAQKSPALRERLLNMGPILEQPARLVDTFFHEREARLSLRYWFDSFQQLELQIMGLLDRYAELDDLPNPLSQVPNLHELETRATDSRFENNLELYLCKNPDKSQILQINSDSYKAPWRLRSRLPPLAWFRYQETKTLSTQLRWQLWQAYLSRLYQGSGPHLDRLLRRLPVLSLQRLARLGVIAQDQLLSRELRELLNQPMYQTMEVPCLPSATNLALDRELTLFLEKILIEKKRPIASLALIWQRLQRAQTSTEAA